MQGGRSTENGAICGLLPGSGGPTTMALVRRVLVLLAGAAVLAGCGGPTIYTRAKTRACLEGKDVKLQRQLDFVASTALGGALNVKLADNQVTIAFGENEVQAKSLARAYRRFRGRNIGIADVLRPSHNAVLLWTAHPSDSDLALVEGCLK
jgi:hypothetical protein